MKKLLALLLATVVFASIACVAGAETKEIVIWRPQNTVQIEEWVAGQIDAFNAEYAGQYHVTQQTFPKSGADSYTEKVSTAVLTNRLPDLLFVDGPNVAGYAENGIIVPLDEFVSAEDKADMIDSCLKQGTYNDKLYAVALWESSVGVFYNKDILAEAGIEVPAKIEDAWTWTQLYDVAKSLTTKDHFGITLNTNASQITYYYSPLYVQLGSDMVSADGAVANGYVNGEAGVKIANYLKSFYTDGIANIEPVSTEFADGKSALWLATSYQVTTLSNYPDLNWGVTYYPVSDEGVGGTPTGSWTVAVTSNASDPKGAYCFLDYLTNTAANITGCPAAGYLPPRKSSSEAMPEFNAEPYAKFAEQLIKNGAPRPRTPVFTALNASYNAGISDIVLGSDAQAKLDEVAQKVDDEYKMNFGF